MNTFNFLNESNKNVASIFIENFDSAVWIETKLRVMVDMYRFPDGNVGRSDLKPRPLGKCYTLGHGKLTPLIA